MQVTKEKAVNNAVAVLTVGTAANAKHGRWPALISTFLGLKERQCLCKEAFLAHPLCAPVPSI